MGYFTQKHKLWEVPRKINTRPLTGVGGGSAHPSRTRPHDFNNWRGALLGSKAYFPHVDEDKDLISTTPSSGYGELIGIWNTPLISGPTDKALPLWVGGVGTISSPIPSQKA